MPFPSRSLKQRLARQLALISTLGVVSFEVVPDEMLRLKLRDETACQDPSAQVEVDEFCADIILARMVDGFLNEARIAADIRDFKPVPGLCQGLLAGFPCQARLSLSQLIIELSPPQGVSRSGLRRGLLDGRTALITEVFRVVEESRVWLGRLFLQLRSFELCGRSWVLLENVSHILSADMEALHTYILEDAMSCGQLDSS